MKLLREHLSFDQAGLILENTQEGDSKNLYLKGIFIQGGVRNLNGRIYPVHEIENAVGEISKTLQRGDSVLGECDHPEKLTINIDRVSHMITDMKMQGQSGVGKLKIVPTPHGNIIRTLVEAGVKLGVSSRGSGDVDDQGVVSSFEIITVDIVAKPSAPDAYPKPIYEALYGRRGYVIDDLATSVMEDNKAQKYLTEELFNWINNLRV
jgi:hypothetical protein